MITYIEYQSLLVYVLPKLFIDQGEGDPKKGLKGESPLTKIVILLKVLLESRGLHQIHGTGMRMSHTGNPRAAIRRATTMTTTSSETTRGSGGR